MTLDEIFISNGTDKSSLNHNYSCYYEMFFESIRHNHLSLLEIGIDSGSSLRSWREYFENGAISGIDLRGNYEYLHAEGIKTYIVDQSNQLQLKEFAETYANCFDIIIDDGSHEGTDMIQTFDILFPELRPGGFYVIEDTLTNFDRSRWGRNLDIHDRIRQMVGEVSINGKVDLGYLCSNKRGEIHKYIQKLNVFELWTEWIFVSYGMVIIKKLA